MQWKWFKELLILDSIYNSYYLALTQSTCITYDTNLFFPSLTEKAGKDLINTSTNSIPIY